MVHNTGQKRAGGRPRTFDPLAALDRAVEVFWRQGYEGASLDALTAAMGIGRPSLYAAFGDKRTLFGAALARYGETVGAEPLAAFVAAEAVDDAVRAFLRTAVENDTWPGGPSGCLFACVAADCAETQPEVRTAYATGLRATERHIADRFARAVAAGELPEAFPAEERARLLVDLMQALALRARGGEGRADLLAHAERQADLIMGPISPTP